MRDEEASEPERGIMQKLGGPRLNGQMPLGEVFGEVASALRGAGLEQPELEARRLLETAIDISGAQLLARQKALVSVHDVDVVQSVLTRRLAHEPLGRIAGQRDFYGRSFTLSEATLEPRADSETLIDVVLDYTGRRRLADHPLKILDVGTGTGCLLLTLLSELPEATGLGTDISGDALETARGNAKRLGLTDRVAWEQTPGLNGIEGPFDILISNPPYIPSAEIAGLAAEVRLHDPSAALDGGADGLEVYRQIARRLAVAVPNGLIVLEVADGDHQRVIDVIKTGMADDKIEVVGCFEDLAGLVRCVALMTLCSG